MKLISYAHVNHDLRSITYYQKKLADKFKNDSKTSSPMKSSHSLNSLKILNDIHNNGGGGGGGGKKIFTNLNDSHGGGGGKGFNLNNSASGRYDVNSKPITLTKLALPIIYHLYLIKGVPGQTQILPVHSLSVTIRTILLLMLMAFLAIKSDFATYVWSSALSMVCPSSSSLSAR